MQRPTADLEFDTSDDDPSVVQKYGSLQLSYLGLSDAVRKEGVVALNRLLAHTMAIRDLYKKAHWHSSGATFYEERGNP